MPSFGMNVDDEVTGLAASSKSWVIFIQAAGYPMLPKAGISPGYEVKAKAAPSSCR